MRGSEVPHLDAIKRNAFMIQPDTIQTILSRNHAKDFLEHVKRAVEITIE